MDENFKLLRIYLNDHLAASVGGVELARRSQSSNDDNEYGEFLATLVNEIEDDRESLEQIMDKLGIPRDPVKQKAAWFLEKAGRLKLNGQLTGYSPLSRLLEFEGLAIAIDAKKALWLSLREVLSMDERVPAGLLDSLSARAEAQREETEMYRIKAAQAALLQGVG